MALVAFDNANPSGGQAGTALPASALGNDKALLDAVIFGQMPGWVFSVSGGTASEPAQMHWRNAALNVWFRASITWGTTGGNNGQMTAITWEKSINGGVDWTSGTGGSYGSEVLSYDASGNLQTTTVMAGMLSWLLSYIGKLKQHAAATSGVHGLGTMASQSAAGVAITGGNIQGVTIIASNGTFFYEREASINKGNISGSTSIDWSAGGHQFMTVTGAGATLTHANLPNAVVGFVTLEVTNGGLATSLLTGCKFVGGVAPVFTNPGKDFVTLMCRDGATVNVVGFAKDVK